MHSHLSMWKGDSEDNFQGLVPCFLWFELRWSGLVASVSLVPNLEERVPSSWQKTLKTLETLAQRRQNEDAGHNRAYLDFCH